jgi:hypothetical protein
VLDFDGSIKIMSTRCSHGSCKLIALKLRNSCSYIVLTKLFELQMYVVSNIMSYMRWNSCDLFNNIHTHRNRLSYNELQMVITTQKIPLFIWLGRNMLACFIGIYHLINTPISKLHCSYNNNIRHCAMGTRIPHLWKRPMCVML